MLFPMDTCNTFKEVVCLRCPYRYSLVEVTDNTKNSRLPRLYPFLKINRKANIYKTLFMNSHWGRSFYGRRQKPPSWWRLNVRKPQFICKMMRFTASRQSHKAWRQQSMTISRPSNHSSLLWLEQAVTRTERSDVLRRWNAEPQSSRQSSLLWPFFASRLI